MKFGYEDYGSCNKFVKVIFSQSNTITFCKVEDIYKDKKTKASMRAMRIRNCDTASCEIFRRGLKKAYEF